MDTFTNDERREVAEVLRGLRHTTYYSEEVVENIKDAIGIADPVNTFREPEDVYELLADLIDPTCEMEAAGDVPALVKGSLETFFCSECGSPIYNDVSPSYGPYCGARVVDDG